MLYSCETLSNGITKGYVYIYLESQELKINSTIYEAKEKAIQTLEKAASVTTTGKDILLAQQAMLEDPELLSSIETLISQKQDPISAIVQAGENFAHTLETIADPYLQQRAADVREIAKLWIDNLSNSSYENISPGSIVVCETIGVIDILNWAKIPIKGVICKKGSPFMHAAIVAQSLEIPVVVIEQEQFYSEITSGIVIEINTFENYIDTQPTDTTHKDSYKDKAPKATIKEKITLIDKTILEIKANTSSIIESEKIVQVGADGIGLFRTEFLLEQANKMLSVDEQKQIYQQIIQIVPSPITFRTFDIGGDKELSFIDQTPQPNPALGIRGMRLYQENPNILYDQLKALYLVSTNRDISIMFPMISSLSDWDFCKKIAQKIQLELDEENINYHVKLGVMLEVPSLAFLIPDLVNAGVSFASIGTNDLSQYFFASDRQIQISTSHTSQLAFSRFIQEIIKQANIYNLSLSICGQLGGDPIWARLLVAMGIRSLSVAIPLVQKIKTIFKEKTFPSKDEIETGLANEENFKKLLDSF